MLNNSKYFFILSLMLVSLPICSMESSKESVSKKQEISLRQLTSLQLNDLRIKVESNQKQHLNKTFSEGDLMINLMSPEAPGAKIIQDSFGGIETWYELPMGSTCTIKQYDFGISPCMSSTKKERLKRLDGKGYAKQNSDGSITLGRIYHNSLRPVPNSNLVIGEFAPLSRELHSDLEDAQKQRRPEGLRDKDFAPSRKMIEKKPTPEELQKIEQVKIEQRRQQFEKLNEQFNSLSIDILQDKEGAQEIINHITTGLNLLSKNLEKEGTFNIFLKNVQGKLDKLIFEIREASRALYATESLPSTLSFFPSGKESLTQKEVKEQALLQIAVQEMKEKSHLTRPNASPMPKVDEEKVEKNREEQEKKTAVYVFSKTVKHDIVESLQQTSTEDSSYIGIKISRERLQNFIEYLHNLEKTIRVSAGESLQNDKLGYYYKPDQGKGSHLKVKFGRGTKPLIFSHQEGIFLTVDQLRDIKNVLIEKGLIS